MSGTLMIGLVPDLENSVGIAVASFCDCGCDRQIGERKRNSINQLVA
jgi:hypothetical protein